MASVNEAILCREPQVREGHWIEHPRDGRECVSAVKLLCDGMLACSTSYWRRGVKVKDNCDTIPRLTAIATFLASGNKYEGHAAIFDTCYSGGIWVFDQWNATGKYLKRRQIPYGYHVDSYNGNNFYVIELQPCN
ncbi:domesticated amidase effector 2-like [Dermacentor variabilis]|uniref:domesticated amidase effector 2-like n=1 Tax=Dermacentor variabilis TaxID=34621 RepID=UPI003F5C2DAE